MIDLFREIEAERGVPIEFLCSALEEALQLAYHEHAGSESADVIVAIDRETATLELHRRRRVVEAISDPMRELVRSKAPSGYEVGDFFDEPVDVGSFGRIAALTAKRVIAQRCIEYDRERVFHAYRPRQGTIVRGLVQREIHGSVYVVFEDGNEAVLPRHERAPHDAFAINDTFDAELLGVYKTTRGPALILSRARASYVRALLDRPEVVAAARRAGYVTVVATTKPLPAAPLSEVRARLDSGRLRPERLEEICWSPDPAEMVAQLLPPGSGDAFAVDEHRVIIVESEIVTPLQCELGRQLTGWAVLPAKPLQSDLALETYLQGLAALEPSAESPEIDPELVAELHRYAEERAAVEDA